MTDQLNRRTDDKQPRSRQQASQGHAVCAGHEPRNRAALFLPSSPAQEAEDAGNREGDQGDRDPGGIRFR